MLGGGVWTPPDVDLAGGADAETAALMARLATLTPQQVRVLMMLSEGLLNKQIAYELTVSEATVKAHVSAILQKLGVDSRTQAVIAAAKIELGQWPQAAERRTDEDVSGVAACIRVRRSIAVSMRYAQDWHSPFAGSHRRVGSACAGEGVEVAACSDNSTPPPPPAARAIAPSARAAPPA